MGAGLMPHHGGRRHTGMSEADGPGGTGPSSLMDRGHPVRSVCGNPPKGDYYKLAKESTVTGVAFGLVWFCLE